MTSLGRIKELALARRSLRWAKEKAQRREEEAHDKLRAGIAEWKGILPNGVKFSCVHCQSAPADLGCVYEVGRNPWRNPCLFCGNNEQDVF